MSFSSFLYDKKIEFFKEKKSTIKKNYKKAVFFIYEKQLIHKNIPKIIAHYIEDILSS